MNKTENIDQEIQKTLDLLEQPETLPPNPFFYTRVKQRLDEETRPRRKSIVAVVLKPALMTLLLAMNVGTAIWYLSGTTGTASETVAEATSSQPRQELIQLLVNDFQLNSTQDNWITLE